MNDDALRGIGGERRRCRRHHGDGLQHRGKLAELESNILRLAAGDGDIGDHRKKRWMLGAQLVCARVYGIEDEMTGLVALGFANQCPGRVHELHDRADHRSTLRVDRLAGYSSWIGGGSGIRQKKQDETKSCQRPYDRAMIWELQGRSSRDMSARASRCDQDRHYVVTRFVVSCYTGFVGGQASFLPRPECGIIESKDWTEFDGLESCIVMSELTRTGVSIEEDLLEQFDRVIAKRGYKNRSEAIRDLIRESLISEAVDQNKPVVATLSMIYDHHSPNLSDKLNEMQHHSHGNVMASTHVHLDADNCLEVVIMKGSAKEIKHLADHMLAMRGVKHGKLVLTATGRDLK